MVWGGRFFRSLKSDLFFVFFSSREVLVVSMSPSSSLISYCIYTRRVFMVVWVMRISIIAWSARCDSFITAGIMPLIAGVISTIFCNSLLWSRSYCNTWNVRWPGGVTNSMNVGGYQRGRLLRPSYSGRERLISGWRCSGKEERPLGRRFL